MNKSTVHIKGMHCASCEMLIEDELVKVPGVRSAKVNQKRGTAEICYMGDLDHQRISEAVEEAGYTLGRDEKPFFSKNPEDYKTLAIAVLLVFILSFFFVEFKLLDHTSAISNNYSSLPIVFLIGITAGLSTCMALVGGLVLGASARFAEKHPQATTLQKFKPHLFFNLGRIASYFILGGLIGLLGSVLQISSSFLGVLTIVVGIVMLTLGVQLLEIFPRFNTLKLTLPKSIGRFLGANNSTKEYSHKNSFVLGALTFFLPCGFTQAMQLFAMSSGSFITGSLTMGIFAIGTAPGLLGIGGLSSLVKGAFAKIFFKVAGVVVILLAFFNISNGYNLTGFSLPTFAASRAVAADPNVTVENGVQIVRMTQTATGYEPNSFTIKKGTPVKWIINATAPNSCSSNIIAPNIGVRKSLAEGENVIEFTPTQVGAIKFSCAMGMYTGEFNVTDGNTPVAAQALPTLQSIQARGAQGSSCGSSGGCGCGSGAKKAAIQDSNALTTAAVQEGNVQVIKTTYTKTADIQPNKFSVKAGTPVRMEIDVKESGSGCMGSIMIPRLAQQPQLLTQGQTITFEFTPQNTGTYPITCAMGIPRGSIVVN